MRKKVTTLLMLIVPLACGCTSSDTDESAGGTKAFDTPEEAFAAFAKAAKANDIKTMATVLSEESRTSFVGGMIFQASMMTMQDEAKEKDLKALLASHGVDIDAEPEPPAAGGGGGMDAMFTALATPIKNIPAFLGELDAWMKKNGGDSENPFDGLGELGEVKIDGDKAVAILETDMGPQPFEFRKADGGWVVHLSSGPPEGDISMPEDDTTPFGTIMFGDQLIPLRHALAYKWKHFDDPSVVVLFTAEPVYERDMNRLKEMLAGEPGEGHFFASGPKVELTLDEEGNLVSMFAWVDNVSMNSNSGVEVDATIEADRVSGMAMMIEPEEFNGQEFSFDANFDAEMIVAD